MTTHKTLKRGAALTVAVLTLLTLLPLICPGQRLDDQITAEAQRLKGVLASLKLSAADVESVSSLLSRSERAAQSGHAFLSLHILQYAATTLGGYEFMQAKAEIGKAGMAAFEQEWRRLGPELAEGQRKLSAARRWPLAAQAVVERSLTQSQPTYQSSLLYGRETSVENGLFYLGLAKAHLDFVAFCRGLKFAGAAPRPLRSPAPELAELEKEVLAAYRKYDTPDQHSAFIRVNSQLKLAWDLERERRHSGAWLQALEARRSLVPITVTIAEDRSAAALRAQSEAVRAQLSKASTDHSLGWLYWQMAEEAQTRNDLKQANTILSHVLPLYFDSLTGSKSLAARGGGKMVTVTLVRWPYT